MLATVGVPTAAASSTVMPHPSLVDIKTFAQAWANSSRFEASVTKPANSTRQPIPNRRARSFRRRSDFVQSHVGGFKDGTHPPAPDFGDDEVLVVGDHLPRLPLL